MASSGRGGGRGGATRGAPRQAAVRVKTAKGRTVSSQRWLARQLNDPYVAAARQHGYRSRSAFKLRELDDRFGFIRRGAVVVDLGAAPGGWTQVAIERIGDGGRVVAIDLLEMDPVAGADVILGDFLSDEALEVLQARLGEGADVVLSDMAAPTTGHPPTDHLRTIALCDAAFDFAEQVLRPGGAFAAKVFKGGSERALLDRMKRAFASVRHAKPPASRAESAETYVVAIGFKGIVEAGPEPEE